jgi:hypothetical protein
MAALSEPVLNLPACHCVHDMMFFQPAAPCLVDAVLDELELPSAMRVGVDCDLDTDFSGSKQMHVAQVKAIGLGV